MIRFLILRTLLATGASSTSPYDWSPSEDMQYSSSE